MGVLDECHYNVGIENGVSVGSVAIEDAVRVLLLGLGEDINREGLRKTPLRVAKALIDGTRGESSLLSCIYSFLLRLVSFWNLYFSL